MELYGHLDLKGIMASVKKSDLEKTKLLQCEWTLKDWKDESKKVGKTLQAFVLVITKTCLYNFYPVKPHFYIVKLGFTGVFIIFHISAQNIDCGYSLEPRRRGGSNDYPQSMFCEAVLTSTHNLCFEQKYEKYHFYLKSFHFLVVKFSIYLKRRVFVMVCFLYVSLWLLAAGLCSLSYCCIWHCLLGKRKLTALFSFGLWLVCSLSQFLCSSSWCHWLAMVCECSYSLASSILLSTTVYNVVKRTESHVQG